MLQNEPVLLVYLAIYLGALAIGVWRRNSFPLGSVLPVVLILGVGFTALVYFLVPQSPILEFPSVAPSEILFVLAYLVFVALLLAFRKSPLVTAGDFLQRRVRSVAPQRGAVSETPQKNLQD